MKALLSPDRRGISALHIAERPEPAIADGEVLVEVHAAGLNFADSLAIGGTYQESPTPPFIPGAEVYGRVLSTAQGVTRCAPGDMVMGQVASGAYAERVAMDPRQLVRVPAPMPAAEGGAFFIAYGTAYSALFQRGHARPGEVVLVLGAGGGVGLAAVQVAHACGLRVIAACRGGAKQALARAAGADAVLDQSAPDFADSVRKAAGPGGCNVVLDMIGGAASAAALKCIAWCGRIVVIGFAGGPPFAFPANHLLVKNCAVIGHWWGDYHRRDAAQLDAAFDHLFTLYAAGHLRPHIEGTLSMAEVPAGIQRHVQGNVRGKLVMLNPVSTKTKDGV